MKSYSLNVKKRTEEKGKNEVGRLRRAGSIPGNLIAKGKSSPLSFGEKDFGNLIKAGLGSSSIIKLAMMERGEAAEAIVKELQRHPVNGKFLHVDFYKVSKGEKLWVKVAIEPHGLAKGVKAGGALEQYINNINVRTVPEALQELIEVDVTNLDKGEAVHFQDLNIPKEWETRIEGNPIVLKVARARVTVDTADEETEGQKEGAEAAEGEAKPEAKA